MASLQDVPEFAGFIRVVSKRTRQQLQRLPLPPSPDPVDRPITRNNKHGFKPPLIFTDALDRRDKMLGRAISIVRALNGSTFANFIRPLRASMVNQAVHPLPEDVPRIQLFAISCAPVDQLKGVVAKVPLFFDAKRELMVMMGNKAPQKFSDWISDSSTSSPKRHFVGEDAYAAQQKWCYARGAAFRFTDLPDDLQNIVLEYMVGEVRHLCVDRQTARYSLCRNYQPVFGAGSAYRHIADLTKPPFIAGVDPGLFALSKDLHAKLKKVIEYDTIKHISIFGMIPGLVRRSWTDILNCLNKIQLDCSDPAYMNFFRVKLPGTPYGSETNGEAPAADLARLPNLRYLELRFHSTMDAGVASPWASLQWHH